MERLSKRWLYYCGLLAGTGLISNVDDLKHIQNLIDAEEQGLLLKLPCKVGDVVYGFSYPNGKSKVVAQEKVEKITIEKVRIDIEDADVFIETDDAIYLLEHFGKRLFLTKEEAEAKLKEMEGES